MLKRHARAACTALAAAGLLLAGTTAAGAATPAADPAAPQKSATATLRPGDAPAELLTALRRDLGLTPTQARDRLAHEAEAGATAARLRARLGAAFAGAWVDGADSATLTVATTRAADTAAIRAAGARAQLVGRSLADLDAAKAGLDRAATAETPVRYVDPRTNTLVVEETRPGAAAALLAATGTDPALATVVRTTADKAPRPLYDLRGGDAYYMNGQGRCSVGFPITRGTTQGFATAGHCGRAGTSTSGFNQVAQGSFQASVFPGNDMAWVAANTNWTATPYVKGSGGANVQVTGSVLQPVGSSVCRSGSTTGWHCGTVQQHNTSVTYPEGTISGVTRTTVCAEPGDSGGSYISGSQAQGVTSGGSGNCSSGGTTFFQPLNPILSAYGLTLKVTGSDPGPGPDPEEPQPGGTWKAGTVYAAGDTVTYGGASYRCLQGHQAQTGWEPSVVPALWQKL